MNLPRFTRVRAKLSVSRLAHTGGVSGGGGVVLRFLLWKFRPPYTRADSEIAAPACILAYMGGKKKEKGKKSGKKTWEKGLADYEVTRGKKRLEITQREKFSRGLKH